MRARRFHYEQDRTRYICGRGLLRAILGRYLEIEPRELRFVEGIHGKPELAGLCSSLRFNLSHSDDLMLVAVAHARAIGIDLELMRDNVPVETLADYYFDPEDAWHLRLLPPAQRLWKFYELWTSAEARLKADGTGITHGLHVFEPDRWSLLKLTPAEGYAATLAVEGADFQVALLVMADIAAPSQFEVIIQPSRGWLNIPWREMWDYRDLLLVLVQRDFHLAL